MPTRRKPPEFSSSDGWTRCQKHTIAQPLYAVCPRCLSDRLSRLCPNCAHDRPCSCLSTSTSSSSSISSLDYPKFDIGSVGRVSRLIDADAAEFGRSRSMGLPFQRTKLGFSEVVEVEVSKKTKGRRWWMFWKSRRRDEKEMEKVGKLYRSSSVGAEELSTNGRERARGFGFYFPSPVVVFRQRKWGSHRYTSGER